MIVRRRLDEQTDVVWATPTSGYGHAADEQPLPYVHRAGEELTPRFGGEEGIACCAPESVGLPRGVLADLWPLAQRWFDLGRRPVNRDWRNVLRSRSRRDRRFLFAHQLDFRPTGEGYAGHCPLLSFERRFLVRPGAVRVEDAIAFLRPVRFSMLDLVVVPLFAEWSVEGHSGRRLEC